MKNKIPPQEPWYLSNIFFNTFFGSVLGLIALIPLAYIGIIFYSGYKVLNIDLSQGVKPVLETLWCGKPGCT